MEGAEKVPFWRKLLHWPVVGGREIIWTCLGANAIPGKVDDLNLNSQAPVAQKRMRWFFDISKVK